MGVGNTAGGLVTLRLHCRVLPVPTSLQEDAGPALDSTGRGQCASADVYRFDSYQKFQTQQKQVCPLVANPESVKLSF